MPNKTSPYLLIFRDVSPDVYSTISAQERQDLMQQWNAWYDGLAAQGKVQHGHPLEPQGRVVSGPRGERVIDGPFAESKEAIGGYFLLTVADLDEATSIAQRCPSLRLGMSVEVRAIADACAGLGVNGRPLNANEAVSA
ncbi:MAG TPA: YciI family protein [Opitutus sp.]|nr:YciI family protein [Opitutus sp.]